MASRFTTGVVTHPWYHSFTSWNGWAWAGWSALVAFGTIGLAVVTFLLVRVTRRSVFAATSQIDIERRRAEAAQWPRVFPMPLDEWVASRDHYAGARASEVIPIKNGGAGVALNVRGQLDFTNQGGLLVELVDTNLGAGDSCDIVLDWPKPRPGYAWSGPGYITDWSDVTGHLAYDGIGGESWKTSFSVSVEGARGYRRVRVADTEMTKRADGETPSKSDGLNPAKWYTPIS